MGICRDIGVYSTVNISIWIGPYKYAWGPYLGRWRGQFFGSSALLVIDPWVELIPVGGTFESARAAMPSGIWG